MARYNSKDDKNNKRSVNYLGRDFVSLKKDLINYTKSYFPNTYNDFNESSPGMMLMEMSAYVGDVLNFYIDQQFKEMLLPTSEERKNLINLANTLGYKVKASVPAFVKLKLTQTIDAIGDQTNKQPDHGECLFLDSGLRIQSSTNSDVFFETLETVDFGVTGSAADGDNGPQPLSVDDDGFVDSYTIQKTVLAISGITKSISFNIKSPQEFLKLTLPDNDVISVISITDSSGELWYEVDYLAQDKVFTESIRGDAYTGSHVPVMNELSSNTSVEKRFIVEVDENNKTNVIFGNGVIRSQVGGDYLQDVFYENQEINSIINNNLPSSLDPAGSLTYKSLGESPSNTTLTIKYRVGGGLKSNVPSGDLTTVTGKKLLNSLTSTNSNDSATILGSLQADNLEPARGGADQESTEQIKERAKATFKSQNRCVTADDYEARVLSLPGRLGNVAKIHVQRSSQGFNDTANIFDIDGDGTNGGNLDKNAWDTLFTDIINATANTNNNIMITTEMIDKMEEIGNFIEYMPNMGSSSALQDFTDINLYVLSYDTNKNLVNTSGIIQQNLLNYLEKFRMISDTLVVHNGYVINFGIYFKVVAHDNVNKSELKLKCIEELIKYFDIDNMKFNQIIYTSALENLLYTLDGVKVVKSIILTQLQDNLGLSTPLYTAGGPAGGQATGNSDTGETSTSYGWAFPFADFYEEGGVDGNGYGVILPPNIHSTPGIFELKNPYDNIKGVVE